MKSKYIKTATVISGGVLALNMSCSKKKDSNANGGATAATVLTPSEDTNVSTATAKLQIASSITILPAKGAAASLALTDKNAYQLTVDSRTLNLRVSNDAFREIEQAGSIMCYFGQSKFWEQANLGVYKALVDQSLCEHDSNNKGQNSGGDSGDQEQNILEMYSRSTRIDGKPLIGEFRIPQGDGLIQAKVVVAAPPSDENPAGIFSMAYTFYSADGTAGDHGFIRTRRTEAGAFILETAGAEAREGRTSNSAGVAQLTLDSASDNFVGYVQSLSTQTDGDFTQKSQYKVRFDSNFLNVSGGSSRTGGGQDQTEVADGCYDRNKFKTGIYSYDIADASGKVVTLNSGFPAEFDKDGKTYSANASYYGVWTNNIELNNDDTIYKVTYTGGVKARTPYKLFKAAGKLIKHVKATTTLGALKGVDLQYNENGDNYIVHWDGTKLSKISKVQYGDKGMVEEPATGDVVAPQWGLNLYVSSLNASVNFSSSTVLSDALVISYHSEAVASGTTDVPAGELVCFSNCPVMAPTAAAFTRNNMQSGPSNSALYVTRSVTYGSQAFDSNQSQDISSPMKSYTFNNTTLLLASGADSFTMPTGLSSGDQNNGSNNLDSVYSGALVPVDAYQALTDHTIDPWRLEQEVDVYYTWTAGPGSYSQFQSLKDAQGAFVAFDRPLDLSYTLATADEFDGLTDTNVVGKAYRLSYGGPGQLWGIPWKYNASVGHEMPLFSLKAGVKIGVYTVSPVEGEQRMASTDATNCTTLSLDALPELPAAENTAVSVGVFGDSDTPTRYISGVAVQ